MLKKLRFIYIHHFKLVIFLNFSLSLYLTYLFVLKDFDKVNLYNIAIALKLIGYAFTLTIEKLFFAQRSFYYRNLGLSYKRILGVFFGLDFLIFIVLLMFSYLCKSYILIV
jgi:hypothetical protein